MCVVYANYSVIAKPFQNISLQRCLKSKYKVIGGEVVVTLIRLCMTLRLVQ